VYALIVSQPLPDQLRDEGTEWRQSLRNRFEYIKERRVEGELFLSAWVFGPYPFTTAADVPIVEGIEEGGRPADRPCDLRAGAVGWMSEIQSLSPRAASWAGQ
jgi:hypothetical protein